MFGSKEKAAKELSKLNERIEQLTQQISELRAERNAEAELTALTQERDKLKRQITDLEVEKSKIDERNARERREVEHKVGLLKQKQEHDTEHAKRMAILEVKEENLKHEKKVFDDQMKFREDQFDKQFATLKGLTEKIFEHLPNVNYDITEDRSRGTKVPEIEAPKPAARGRTRRTS